MESFRTFRERDPRPMLRGDLFYITKTTYTGSEIDPKGGRPAVIVSDNSLNCKRNTVTIVYLTTKSHEGIDTQFYIEEGKCYNSYGLCEQITTVDKSFVGDFIGHITDEEVEAMDMAILCALGIRLPSAPEPTKTEDKSAKVYKALYETLLKEVLGD